MNPNINWQGIKTEAMILLRSFIGAVAAAATLAALNWIGTHIPTAIQALGIIGGAYGGAKTYA